MPEVFEQRSELSQWRGWRRFDRMLARYALLSIVVIALVLVTFERLEQLNASYADAESIRRQALTLLNLQLDEETGIRGYDATKQSRFLEPYSAAHPQIEARVADLQARVPAQNADGQAIVDFARAHDEWERSVAKPIVSGSAASRGSTEFLGKALVDRMRADLTSVDRINKEAGIATLDQAHLLELFCVVLLFAAILMIAVFAYRSERIAARHEESVLRGALETRDTATRLSDWRAKVVAMLAHDFKSTLGVIKGYNAILRGFPERRNDAGAYAGIDDAVAQLASMADEAVLMARVASGALIVRGLPLRVNELLEETAHRYESRGIRIAAPDLTVIGDRAYLLRVFDNLIGNAVKYSPPGSAIDVRATGTRGGGVTIAIRDRGKGVSPDDLPHVFEEYYRAADASGASGSGVGLFIVKKIVEAHGGTVSMESKPGVGTTVSVALPGVAETPARTPATVPL